MSKSIRFSELVSQSGKPQVVTLWTDPKEDDEFMQAVKENRVLTVRQEAVGAKADFGVLGFHEQRNASYFVFPKPLPDIANARVVGIQYDLLEQPVTTRRWMSRHFPEPKLPLHRQKIRTPPPEKEFTATLRRTAKWKKQISVMAHNEKGARKKLEQIARDTYFDFSAAEVEDKVENVKEES